MRLGLFTLLLLAMAVTVALDHVAFLLAQAAVGWARELPTVPVTLTVKYDVSAVTRRCKQSHFLEANDCCCCLVTQSCQTVCNPLDCSPPGSSVHGILQARILEWVAMPFFQEIFPIQGLNQCLLHLLHCRQILDH